MARRRIIDGILDKRELMAEDPVAIAVNQTLAVLAIHGGIDSVEWRSYVMQFLEQDPPGTPVDEAQLKRLLGTDGTRGDPYFDLRRAYIFSGGPCGSETKGLFGVGVNTIDRGLEPECLADDDPRLPKFSSGEKTPKKRGAEQPGYPK